MIRKIFKRIFNWKNKQKEDICLKKRVILSNNYDIKNIVSSDYYYHDSDKAGEILLIKKDNEKSISLLIYKLYDVFMMMDRMKNYPKFRKEYSIDYIRN